MRSGRDNFKNQGIWGRWEVKASGMRHVVKCSMRQSVLGGKQRRTTEPGARSLSVMNLPPCLHNSEMQEAAGFLAIHRGLKARVGQKFQPGGYFRSWTTVILAKNSEATLTSPIGFFVNFDTGCFPRALKRVVCVLCQHLLCQKPGEEMKVRLA